LVSLLLVLLFTLSLRLGEQVKNNFMAKATKKKVSVAEISALAKKIRKADEKWTDAIKRASAQLK